MKGFLRNNLYIKISDLSFDDRRMLEEKLIYHIVSNPNAFDPKDKYKTIYGMSVEGDYISLPRGAVKFLDVDIIDERTNGTKIVKSDSFKIKLRKESKQDIFVDKLYEQLSKNIDSYGVAHTGVGKTVCAIELMKRLRRTTFIIVHTSFLMEQWIKRIKTGEIIDGTKIPAFWPELDVGIVQQDKCEFKDKDVVIGMIQSLSRREYPEELYKWPGLVIADEVHLLQGELFGNVIPKFWGIRLGLSATDKRSDGLEELTYLHLNEPIIRIAREAKKEKIQVETWNTSFKADIKQYSIWTKERNTFIQKPSLSKLYNLIANNEKDNLKLVELCLKYPDRKVLFMSERLSQIEFIRNKLKEKGIETGLIIGGQKKEKREQQTKYNIIFTTRQLASTALDIPTLSVIIFGTPQSKIIQAVGRIDRNHGLNPIVIDRIDNIGILKGMYRKRINQYKSLKAEIKDMDDFL